MVTDEWDEYVPSMSRPEPTEAVAIIGRGGGIRLTPRVVESMGSPTHVVLAFDRVGGRVSIEPSSPDVRHAFPLKRYGNMKMATVSGEGFLQWAGIDYGERREFDVNVNEAPQVMFRVRPSQEEGPFEKFEYKNVAVSAMSPNVSISRNGNITLNRFAARHLGNPERVVLLYNRRNPLIGLRAASGDREGSPLRKSSGQNTWTVSAEGFLKRYDVPHEQGRSYEPRVEAGVLVIDLRQPKQPRRRSRPSRGEQKK